MLEGANGPTYPDADDVLASRGILVVPDVVCQRRRRNHQLLRMVQRYGQLLERRDRKRAHGQNHDRAIVHVWEKRLKSVLCAPQPILSPVGAFCWPVRSRYLSGLRLPEKLLR